MLKYSDTQQFISDYRKYLDDSGISNAHIARKMDISPQQLQNVWKKKELTVSDIKKLCDAINMQCNIAISNNRPDIMTHASHVIESMKQRL